MPVERVCGFTAPGLVQFDVGAGTVTIQPVGGAVVAIQPPVTGSSPYLAISQYSVITEDPVAGTAPKRPGYAVGTKSLAIFRSGNSVAGASQIASNPNKVSVAVSLLDTASHQVVGAFTYPPKSTAGYMTRQEITPEGIA